jgi:mannose/fructose/N-acetylgalactosamine-specific phosphotransferase system component IID
MSGTDLGAAITSVKTGLMGPIAGMGDAIVWAVVMPIIYGMFIPFAADGNAIGGIMPMILWPGITIIIQYFITHYGYKFGRESITGILQSGVMQSIIYAANVLGLIMMGALSSSYIDITTPLTITMGAGNVIEFQAILDSIAPGILPLIAVFSMYFYMQKKGPRYNVILIAVIVVSVVCAFLGIL